MTRIRLAVAAFVAVGLLAASFAAEAKKHSSARHHGTRVVAPIYGSSATAPVATQPRAYGSSGQSVGTVTAPSVGTYNWPSVGVTNSVPTWRNTNPPIR
ncbi:hypothetical protein QA641_42750 [Bradyrhizobium sp. CB1650]|uniref:hypothetical protein n=1 Tax=Bradyrhizobium sp. CB1650 TaxID=3039153 RepID=UPI002434B2F6|nr:hypothetical protein [Bradyrhizobium sp. CB1650]WGD52049.1 hypothetical protein QA641_42750 [Bradyrhizobium sp. CB1650]